MVREYFFVNWHLLVSLVIVSHVVMYRAHLFGSTLMLIWDSMLTEDFIPLSKAFWSVN